MMLKQAALAFALSIGFIATSSATNVTVTEKKSTTGYDYVIKNNAAGSGGLFAPGDNFAYTSEVTKGSFLDTWSFGLSSSALGKGSATTYEITSLQSFEVILYQGTLSNYDPDKGFKLKTSYDADNNVFTAKGKGLYPSAGSYFYTVSGTNSSGVEEQYHVSTVLSVPEPESYAMLLAGLGLMATIARRRNQSKAS